MRKFSVFIFTLFVIPTILFMVVMTRAASILDSGFLKSNLAESKIYDQAIIYGEDFLDKDLSKAPIFRPLIKDIKAEVTSGYLQSKVEPVLDQVFFYLQKETEELPTVSFTDLSAKLKKRNPLFTPLFQTMGAASYLEKPLTIPTEYVSYASQARNYYYIISNSWWWSVVLAVILLLIIFLIAGRGGKFKAVGRAILIPSTLGLLLTASLFFWLQPQLPAGIPEVFKAPALYFIAVFIDGSIRYLGLAYLLLAVLGIVLYKGPSLVSKKTS